MRNTFNILFYANRSKEKEGQMPVLCRITVNGTVAQFSCKMSVPSLTWDPKTGRMTGRSHQAVDCNLILDGIRARIVDVYHELSMKGGVTSAWQVREYYLGKKGSEISLLDGIDKQIEAVSSRVGRDRASSTYFKYKIVRGHCVDYMKDVLGRSDIPLAEIDESFMRGFCNYLRDRLCLSQSSVWVYQMPLRTVVTAAFNDGLILKNPFVNYRVSPDMKERGFLTEGQLRRLIHHQFPEDSLKAFTRDLFVFCCFTGLSFADLRKLSRSDIVDINDSHWIVSRRQKTKVHFQAKLLPVALDIIKRHGKDEKDEPLFDVGKYTTVCKRLKVIGAECGVSDNLCFHQARHTFATLALSKGMSMESLRSILGHTDIRTTQIYAKITCARLDKDYSCLSTFCL